MSTKSQLSPMHEWAENQFGLTWSLPNDDSLRVGKVFNIMSSYLLSYILCRTIVGSMMQ